METEKFVNGQKWSENFDYAGMLEYALKVKPTDSLKKLKMLAYSMVEVNYHPLAKSLNKAIDKLTLGNFDIKAEIEQFIADVQEELTIAVVFYYNEKNNDLFAFFPETINGNFGQAYSHIGQHSECHYSYVQESRIATENEYKDLKNELEQGGYKLRLSTLDIHKIELN